MTVVGVVSRCGLRNKAHSRDQPSKTKLALKGSFITIVHIVE